MTVGERQIWQLGEIQICSLMVYNFLGQLNQFKSIQNLIINQRFMIFENFPYRIINLNSTKPKNQLRNIIFYV